MVFEPGDRFVDRFDHLSGKEQAMGRIWPTGAAARSEVVQFVEGWYNRRRRHSALDYLTPVEFEAQPERQAA